MNCEGIWESLPALLDDELPPEVASLVTDHLAGCAACGRELEGLRTTRRDVAAALALAPEFASGSLAVALDALLARIDDDRPTESTAAGRALAGTQRVAHRPAAVAPDAAPLRRAPGRQVGRALRGRPTAAGRTAHRPWVLAGGFALAATALLIAVDRVHLSGPTSALAPVADRGGSAAPPPRIAAAAPGRGSAQGGRVAAASPAKPARAVAQLARDGSQGSAPASLVATAEGDQAPSHDLQVPDEVRRQPGLFLDLDIVRRLEKLRHLEAVYRQPGAATEEGGSG